MRRVLLLLLVTVLAACGRPAVLPAEPVTVTLTPNSGPPGTEVTVRIRFREPGLVPLSGPEGKSWYGHTCWAACAPPERQGAPFIPAVDDPYLFIGRLTVPAFQQGRLVGDGALELSVTCQTKGCEGVPAARSVFNVTGGLPGLAWSDLPAGRTQPGLVLAGTGPESVDPTVPRRRVVCKTGDVTGNLSQGGVPPQLQVTVDGGGTWRSHSLAGVKLGQSHGYAGCRAVALDPHNRETFYVAGGGHMAASGWDRSPAPLFTTDNGATWNRINPPADFDAPDAFIGFQVDAEGVSAWFGRPDPALAGATEKATGRRREAPDRVMGTRSVDGGKTWQTVPLGCPADRLCVWELPASLFLTGYRGLLVSDDGGQTWRWASWAGKPIQTLGRHFENLGNGVLEVAGACFEGEGRCVPLLHSADWGRDWQWVTVPAPAGGWPGSPDVHLQPDGSLLLKDKDGGRYQLRRGQSTWEPAAAAVR